MYYVREAAIVLVNILNNLPEHEELFRMYVRKAATVLVNVLNNLPEHNAAIKYFKLQKASKISLTIRKISF